jgi:hypothetical protein
VQFLAKGQEMTGDGSASGADLHDAPWILLGGRGNLMKNGLRGEEMLTELARQVSSVEHVAKLIDLAI